MRKVIILTVILILGACNQQDSSIKETLQKEPSTIFDTQMESLEKAQGVESSLQGMKDERDQVMQKQGA